MTWKPTIAEVLAITRKTVTDAQIDAAVNTVELFSGVFLDTTLPQTTARDLRCLKNMTAYQAAWEPDQPDLVTAKGVVNVSQDGNAVTFAADGQVLAPFARLWLKRLSWKGSRSVQVLGATQRRVTPEDALPWEKL